MEVIAIAVAPAAAIEGWCQSAQTTYPVLADPAHRVTEAYGVYNLLGDGFAAPAAFVIDMDGRIVWSHVGWNYSDLPSVQTIIEHLP